MDEQLQKIGEIKFDKREYNPYMAVLTDKGLAIPRVDLYGQNEDEIVLDLFTIDYKQNALAVSN